MVYTLAETELELPEAWLRQAQMEFGLPETSYSTKLEVKI